MYQRLAVCEALVIGFLAAVVGVGRFYTADHRGIYHSDEATYLLETKTFRRAFEQLKPLLHKQLTIAELKVRLRNEGAMGPPGTAKPTYSLLLFASSLFSSDLAKIGNILSVIST